MRAVVKKREAYLRELPAVSLRADGRLLAYQPGQSFMEGASQAVSEGFLDYEDKPPWDTWLCYISHREQNSQHFASYLVSWVPPEFVARVEDGIAVNSVGNCIQWLSIVNPEFDTKLMDSLQKLTGAS